MSYVSTAYLPRCFRMYDVCVMYVRRIGPATYVSGYEFLSAHINQRTNGPVNAHLRSEIYTVNFFDYNVHIHV